MADASPDSALIKIVGPLIGAAIGGAAGWLPGWLGAIKPELTALLAAAGGVAGLVFSVMYKRYVLILGASGRPKGYADRDVYDRLRESLSGENLPSRIYANWLTKFLDAIDRFLGDADMADRTLFAHAFGLKTRAPLWTAPAFDRCMFLACVYPVVTIIGIWSLSGHVGPAEAALTLEPLPGWRRGIVVLAAASAVLTFRKAWQSATTLPANFQEKP